MASQFKEKIVIFVPHEDDEINLAGVYIKGATEAKKEVYVVFFTNGDYSSLAEIRYKEAIKSCNVLGVSEENVIFMGYPDELKEENHFYFTREENYVSNSGQSFTYGTDHISEWIYKREGVHHRYVPQSAIDDICDIIFYYKPDLIIVNGFDDHPDHKALFLLVMEALKNILNKTKEYCPVVWVGFCYETAWYAEKDYKHYNLDATNKVSDRILNVHNFQWKERIRIGVPQSCRTGLIRRNDIYRALQQHSTQWGIGHFLSVMNSDQVFWPLLRESILAIKLNREGKSFEDCIDCGDNQTACVRKKEYKIDYIKITIDDNFVYEYHVKTRNLSIGIEAYSCDNGRLPLDINRILIKGDAKFNYKKKEIELSIHKHKTQIECSVIEEEVLSDKIMIIYDSKFDVFICKATAVMNLLLLWIDRKINRVLNICVRTR